MPEWYYRVDEQEQGPLSEEDLRHVFECGALPPTTYVWREGMQEWCRVSECKEFLSHDGQIQAVTAVLGPPSQSGQPRSKASVLNGLTSRGPWPISYFIIACVLVSAAAISLNKQKALFLAQKPRDSALSEHVGVDTTTRNPQQQRGPTVIVQKAAATPSDVLESGGLALQRHF